MRVLRLACAILLLATVTMTAPPATIASRPAGGEVTDPRLIAEIDRAQGRRLQGGSQPTVTVEVLTGDLDGISKAVTALGGAVTGRVPGALVQAKVPVNAVAALANTPGARFVQYPRRSGYIPGLPARRAAAVPGTGTVSEAVSVTNADDWHLADLTGAGVKVGVIDYFDTRLWNTAEHGPFPDSNHMFCQDSLAAGYCLGPNAIDPTAGFQHGLAVVEVVKDMAPQSEVHIATAITVADLAAAIDWFATKGVTVLTRSLGSAFDGPGDGTGALANLVDYAVARGMTWFNSAGNEGVDAYMRRSVPTNLAGNGYVNFNDGRFGITPAIDTWLRLDGCVLFDGVRWSNDWYLPAAQRTDYSLEFWEPLVDPSNEPLGDHYNPTSLSQVKKIDLDGNPANGIGNVYDANQRVGAFPLEAEDLVFCPNNFFGPVQGISYLRIKRNSATPVGAVPDQLEIATAFGFTELDYSDVAGSAARSVVDSKNPGLVAVGAVDPPGGAVIAYYSSQGPTNDGRIKPDVSAPAGFTSWTYANDGDDTTPGVFSGTSAASPAAAGMAALLQGAGLAVPGAATAALVKRFSTDLGTPGMDNAFGAGAILLPAPPSLPAPSVQNAAYEPLGIPQRILDTRPSSRIGPPDLTGPYAANSMIDLDVVDGVFVPNTGVSAVALNITSTSTTSIGFIQAYPYLRATAGATSTLNISTPGAARPNFAIVPVGVDGRISIYIHAGGNVIVDVLGYFEQAGATSNAGRFIAIPPERWTDSRGADGAPLPVGFSAARPAAAGETIEVPTLPSSVVPTTGVEALVVNVTAANAVTNGYLRAVPTGLAGATHSTVNFSPASASANTAIVPIGISDHISVYAKESTNVIVDVVGYITSSSAGWDSLGLFRPITPGRAYNSKLPSPNPFAAGESRTIQLTGLSAAGQPVVPADSSAVSANLTVAVPAANGNLKMYPTTEPATSSLNYAAGKTVANGALLLLGAGGTVIAKMSQAGHVLVDVNGYFLPARR